MYIYIIKSLYYCCIIIVSSLNISNISSHDISSYPIFHLFRLAIASRLPNGRRRHLRVVKDVSQDAAAGDHRGGSKGGGEAEDGCQIAAGVEVPRRMYDVTKKGRNMTEFWKNFGEHIVYICL